MNLQPYQEASEELKRQSRAPIRTVGNIASTVGVVGGGSAILSKILPFLNKYIPTHLAIKGIKKVNPKIGKFVETSMNQGYPVEDVFSLLKEKAGIKEEEFAQTDEEAEVPPMEDQRQQSLQQFNQRKSKPSLVDQETQRFNEYYGQKQNNQTDEALMAALNKILSM